MFKSFLIYIAVIIFFIILNQSTKYDPLVFNEVKEEASQDERISICHATQGYIGSKFDYQLTEYGNVIQLSGGKPVAYCSFFGSRVILGKITRRDENKCHTLTKAEIKRGGRPTYSEYNPKYSVYKDGMIYWSCKNGKKPHYSEVRKKFSELSLFRYEVDNNILLVKGYDYKYYLLNGVVFRKVNDNGKMYDYNEDNITLVEGKRFDFSPKLIYL